MPSSGRRHGDVTDRDLSFDPGTAAMGGQNLSAVTARRPAGMGYLRADVLGERRSLIYLLDIFRLAAWPARPG